MNVLWAHLDRPPGRLFHAVVFVALVFVALAWIAAFWSYPGPNALVALPAGYVLAAAGLVWVLRGATYGLAGRRGQAPPGAARFLVAPCAGLLFLGLVLANMPLRARWEPSRSAFADVVEQAPPAVGREQWVAFPVPEQVGFFKVSSAVRVGEGLIFYEKSGYVIDDAGFAYLPNGPFEDLSTAWFESPTFRSLGDGWYAWTASW